MDNMQIINIGGVGCYELDGIVYLLLDAVVTGLGFTKTDVKVSETGFRKEYVRIDWPRVNKLLADLGFPNKWGKGDFIPENVFYRLAMKAKNPVAEAFQAKVADEIIPSIRKHGAYIAPQPTDENSDDLAIINGYKALMRKVERLESKVAIMEHKASYYDIVLATKDLVPITLIAKDYGMSATEMNKILHEHGYQYKRNKTWVLYDKYADKGYTSSKTHIYEDCYGRERSQMHTCWTQAGRLFIYNELKKFGILPMVEQRLI